MKYSIQSGFAGFPSVDLIGGPTPLQRAVNLEMVLRGEGINAGIYLKRDDLMPIGGGGNKIRKLQYHMAAILGNGADTVVTFGGIQSNHARLTAAVSARLGLECHLVLSQQVDIRTDEYQANGNPWLNRIFGANSHLLDRDESAELFAKSLIDRLEGQGKKVAVIPTGGSTALGALGYAECAFEIAQQADAAGLNVRNISLANGSSGTQAGLIAGWIDLEKSPDIITGYAVMASRGSTIDATRDLAASTLKLIGGNRLPDVFTPGVDDSQLGAAYGQPTQSMVEAVGLLAKTEGVLLDPVYSGKAFAGLLAQLRAGAYASGDDVIFLMTGGVPSIYAYQGALDDSFSGHSYSTVGIL
ncbi:D-cysteine desulfhydrase family protein [Pseudomonas sp. NPDC088444]|uniref:D-cysteine desulfhydrase family protein n=1 Tax=Pseudomonas sp. NPDC088444 TaxID=3364456 RepID=UPI003850F1A2